MAVALLGGGYGELIADGVHVCPDMIALAYRCLGKDNEKALEEFEKRTYDAVLLDVMMPQMNGWDTLKAIRSNKKHQYLPVIMITAVNEDQKIVSGLKIGADDYIVKPFILPLAP